jgi:hypothetical protein
MPEPKKVEVTLAQKHVHASREYKRGDVLELREDQAAWLIAKHVAVKKGDELPPLPSEIKTVKDMREVEAAVAEDQRAKAVAKAAKA